MLQYLPNTKNPATLGVLTLKQFYFGLNVDICKLMPIYKRLLTLSTIFQQLRLKGKLVKVISPLPSAIA